VSEEVNRKLRAGNMMVHLTILYIDPKRHNAQRYWRTDGQSDNIIMSTTADYTACRA